MKKKNLFLSQVEYFFVEQYGSETGTKLILKSRERFLSLCQENQNEAEEMYIHTRERIYPAIATFDAMIQSGIPRSEAVDFVQDFYGWRSQNVGKKISKIMAFPLAYRLALPLARFLMKKLFHDKSGFLKKNYDAGKHNLRFDMLTCPYQQICKDYGCPEIVTAFCKADDICFGSIHEKIAFSRTKSLAKGDSCCNFSLKLR